MIRAAIVEDDEATRTALRGKLEQFGVEKDVPFSVEEFSDGQNFVFNDAASYDLVLMDIDMPKMDGLSAARALRKVNESAVLIFITSLMQYAINGYEVGAFAYIVKPINFFSLERTLEKAVRLIRRDAGTGLYFRVDGDMQKVNAKDILYFDVFGHEVVCHTLGGDLRIPNSLNELENQLSAPPLNFLRIPRSVLINPQHISEIRPGSVVVGKSELPLSRAQRKKVLDRVCRYFGEGE